MPPLGLAGVQSVLFNQSDYYSHSTVADWGLRHDGLHAYAGRGALERHNYDRTPDGFRRFGGGYSGNRGEGFGRLPDRYAENWRGNSNRGFHAFGGGYERTPRQAYNHMQSPESRQQFDRSGYRSSLNRRTGEGYRRGAGAAYDRSMQAYRAPTSGFQRGEFGGQSSEAFASRNFAHSAGKPPYSGGFHLFGGGHAPKSFHGGGKNFGGGALARRRRSLRRSRRRQASTLRRAGPRLPVGTKHR